MAWMLLCVAASAAHLNLPGAETCSDIQSMMNVWDSTAPSLSYPFALTGTVHSAVGSTFVLDDGNLLVPVLNMTEPHVDLHDGNRVALSGIFGLKKAAYGNEPYTVARQARILDVGMTPLPAKRTLQDLSSSRGHLRLVETTGTIIDYRADDADPDYLHLILKDGPTTMPVSIFSKDVGSVGALVDAQVSVVGTFNRTLQGVRRYSRPFICSALRDIRVVAPPPPPEHVPVLERKIYLTPKDILSLGKRKISGEIIAVWQTHNLLLRDDDGRIVRVRLTRHNKTVPRPGLCATICGYPETDQFNIILGTATIASCTDGTHAPESPDCLASPAAIISQTPTGPATFKHAYYGKLVRLGGTVRNLPSPGNAEGRIGLDCGGRLVQLDTSACPDAAEGLELGCRIEATGVCLLEMNDYDAQTDTPHVSGLTLLLRSRNDVAVLSRPPWLTPMRFLAILSAMAGILVLVLVWNASLRVLAERRGRELARREAETANAKFKTLERTRLATELHDSVVQNLTGAALEIRAARAALGPDDAETAPHLDIALKTVNSSRAELRNCIWDLRNQALEQKDTDEAVRITLQPHLGGARLQIRFNVPRRRIPDSEFHSILCMIRELVVNAVRHGAAAHVRVAGTLDGNRIRFSVTDDGRGFDPATRPGMEQGHFGLEGVTERAKALDGTIAIESAPGMGAHVAVNVVLLGET